MLPSTVTLFDADASHVAAIVAIEREISGPSIVALTNGAAVELAIARGHHVVVALDGGEVAGWAWFSLEDARGGEVVGQLSRVAVATSHRGRGVGRGLIEHVQIAIQECGATSIRLSVDADDAGAVAFFEHVGFARSVVAMERRL